MACNAAQSTGSMLGPLRFPEVGSPDKSFPNSSADAADVTCLLCSTTFDLTGPTADFLRHLQVTHSLVIAEVNLICDLKRYVEYWRARFSQESYTAFCSLVKLESATDSHENGTTYYLLSDATEEDKKVRADLQLRRLDWVLGTQQQEREDSTFSRGCLFCREHFEGNRAALFNHMAFDHHFSVGQPNNIVFANEFLDVLEEKLSNFKCLYCDKTFKDRLTLREHMRKKMHKRLNPRNPLYDKFYVINYLELGKNWEAVLSEVEEEEEKDGTKQDKREDNWADWEGDCGPGAFCLFCTVSTSATKQLEMHMLAVHGFDLQRLKQGLNFYLQVKLINYIRRCVHQGTCMHCKEAFSGKEALCDHMTQQGHMTSLPSREDWDQPQYFFPTFENDTLLCELDGDDEDNDGPETRAEDTPIIPEDAPVPSNSILRDSRVLQGLRDS